MSPQTHQITKSESVAATVKDVASYLNRIDSREMVSSTKKLSERESVVANLLLAGFNNKYIAYKLGISEKTVSTFKKNVYSKLGVKSIIELSNVLKDDN